MQLRAFARTTLYGSTEQIVVRITLSAPENEEQKKLTRRGFIKWTSALAVAGAAVVGIGAGYGADLLTRPTTEKTSTTTKTITQGGQTATATETTTQTATSTATKTVTAPVVTLSYKPPLSPEVQAAVSTIESNLVNRTAGETTTNTSIYGFWSGPFFVQFLKARTKNGVVVRIEADDSINKGVPREDASSSGATQGTIQCRGGGGGGPRTYAYLDYMYRPERLLYPMKKVGARGDPLSKFVRISWDEAFTTIASKMKDVVSKYGPYSIGAWYTGSIPTAAYINAGCTGWGIASNESHNFASAYVFGGGGDSDMVDIFNTKLVVLWGADPTNTSLGGEFGYYVRLAREKNIPVVCIDSRYSKAAEVLSDQWIPIKSGTDSAMQTAVANVLLTENLYNSTFVSKFVEPTGFAKWKDYVLGMTDGVSKTPEWQEPITGVPAQTVREFARLYAKSAPTWMVYSWCPARQVHGEDSARLGMLLQSMMGYVGVPGGQASVSQGGGWTRIPSPSSPSATNFGGTAATYRGPVLFKNYKWADAVLLKPQFDAGTITKTQYYDAIGNPDANPAPNLKFIWFNTNLLNQTTNINKQIEAVKNVEMAVSAVWHMDQPTGMVADIVLPRAEVFEEDPQYTAFGYSGFALSQKVVKPQGEAKSILRIHVGIAEKLGVAQQYAPQLANLTDDQWDAAMTAFVKASYEKWATAQKVTTTWDDFLKSPIYRMPVTTPTVAFSAQIAGTKTFGTPSGKIEFNSDYLATTDLTKTKYGGPLSSYPIFQAQAEGYYDPKVTKYPLMMISPHSRYRMHSWMDGSALLRTDAYRHALWINVADAKARGITDGDLVSVYNDVGQAVIPAYVTSKIVPGTVNLYEGGWLAPNASGIDKRGAPNVLHPDTDNPSGQWPFHGLVEVEKF